MHKHLAVLQSNPSYVCVSESDGLCVSKSVRWIDMRFIQ